MRLDNRSYFVGSSALPLIFSNFPELITFSGIGRALALQIHALPSQPHVIVSGKVVLIEVVVKSET
jgi:hypothetical protein